MMENPQPTIIEKSSFEREKRLTLEDLQTFDETNSYEPLDEQEVFEWIKNLKDPEYPLTLEELKVIDKRAVKLDRTKRQVTVEFTPTVPHCSQATLIGLMLKCVLQWSLPRSWKVCVYVKEGTHSSESSINKQLADKERVAAALENPKVLAMIVRGVLRTRTIDEVLKANLRIDNEDERQTNKGRVILPVRKNARPSTPFCPL